MSESRGFITACEQEALHLSGAIQGHGALLVCDAEQRVTHASANLHEWLGQPPEALIGQPLPAELADCLAALDGAPGRRLQLNALAWLEHETALNAVRTDAGGMLVELLPALGSHPEPFGLRAPAEASPLAFRTEAELHAARDGLLDMLLRHSGFDRVLYYAFLPGGDGEVLAEACADSTQGSYLGLRFPASDIPQIARALYVKNPWRAIPDVRAASVAILGRHGTPPDLTLSDLRSVSPVHQLYMANMGLRSAVSFPLLGGGELAGLISLHGHVARRLSPQLLQQLAEAVKRFELAHREYRTRQQTLLADSLERHFHALRRPCRSREGSNPPGRCWRSG